jgi:hypothetical protein
MTLHGSVSYRHNRRHPVCGMQKGDAFRAVDALDALIGGRNDRSRVTSGMVLTTLTMWAAWGAGSLSPVTN